MRAGCNDCHRKRLQAIRDRLGWDVLAERTYDAAEEAADSRPMVDDDLEGYLDDRPAPASFNLGSFVPFL